MFNSVFAKIFGTKADRDVKRIQPVVVAVQSFEAAMIAASNDALRSKTGELRQRLAQGATLDDILPEAFAVVRETAKRTLGMRHYDVQIVGGVVLHRGGIAR